MTTVVQPSGTVTFVFTDVEGSTRLLEELGPEGYRTALGEHRRIVREAFAAYSGYEVDFDGDSFFYAFASAPGAVAGVSGAMAGLESGPIRIRVGIHTGEPILDPPKYVGLDVHRAARVMSSAHGGQVVVSPTTVALLEPGSVQLRELGQHRMKDLSAPIPLFQLQIDGLQVEFPPLKTLYRSNLPVPATPFLGRERELGEVTGRLSDPGPRLLTLTGPGGTGKTRLALQAAAEVADGFPDGVFWVALAPLRDPALVVTSVAQALEVTDRADEETTATLARALLGKSVLVVLDNIEHLLPTAATELAGLAAACPTLRLLVTSRERLQLQVESVWPVPPLSEQDGERLFVERARAAGVDLVVDEAVVELCRRLDELPLALELAAARTVVFGPRQLLDRLGARLDLLKAGRDADPRQLTLRATIDWSYDLLDEEEKRAFRALSVFRGGSTYEAAEEICDAELDTLQSLLDKSLLRRREGADGEPRFWMLETIREFAREHLEQAGELNGLRTRHADWYADAAAARADDLYRESLEAKQWVTAEIDNLRASLARLVEERQVEGATRLATNVMSYFQAVGDYREALTCANAVLALEPSPSVDLGVLQRWAATALKLLGDRAAARSMYETAATTSQTAGDETGRSRSMARSAALLIEDGEIERGSALMEDAIARERQLGDWRSLGGTLYNYGVSLVVSGEPERAVSILEEARSVAEGAGIAYGVTITMHALGWAALKLGDIERALSYSVESLAGFVEHGDRDGVAYCLNNVSSVLARLPFPREAALLAEAGNRIHDELGVVDRNPMSREEGDATRSLLQDALGPDFELLQAQGRQLTDAEAIELALEATDRALGYLKRET